jgi:hypothetical protein
MDKFFCILIDAKLTPELLSYAAHYSMLVYDNFRHSAFDNHKSPNDVHGHSPDLSKLDVFGSICFALQPPQFLHKLQEKSAKVSFVESTLLPAKFWIYKVGYVARTANSQV